MPGAPDPPPELVKLRQAESVCVLDDHEIRVRNIDPYLDNGRRDEELHFSAAELLHHRRLLARRQPSMQEPHANSAELSRQLVGGLSRGLGVDLLRLLDQRENDISFAPLTQIPGNLIVRSLPLPLAEPECLDSLLSRGKLIENGDIELPVQRQGDRPRDRRCTHYQQVDGFSLLLDERALNHAKSVLLVDDRQAQLVERNGLLDEGMRPDDQVDLTGRDLVLQLRLPLRRAGQQSHPNRQTAELLRETERVLLGQDLRRNHEHGLVSCVDHRQSREDGDNRLP